MKENACMNVGLALHFSSEFNDPDHRSGLVFALDSDRF